MSNNQDILNISEIYGYYEEDMPDRAYPIRYHGIAKAHRNDLYILLNKYQCLFDGNLGTWHCKPYDIKLKPDAEP